MKLKFLTILIIIIILSSCLVSVGTAGAGAQPEEKVPVIIGFKEKPDRSLIMGHGGDIKHTYRIIPAMSARLSNEAIEALKKNKNIAYVQPDYKVYALGETLPWGIDRIDAENVHLYNKGTGIKVAVIDTGIDYTHPDLDTNYKGGFDFVNNDTDPRDDAGHGTHCAGIVAAVDNEEGVIGVAPEAHLYAVKVLNSGGSGSISDVVEGIEWAINNDMQVISMSLGSDSDSTALHDACDEAYNAGIVVIAAAGNDYKSYISDTVDYPARYDSVIAVAATDINNERASFSSTGPDVELAAPGVNINSTLMGGGYGTKSGTSMAAPHVSGTAALILASDEMIWMSSGYTNGDDIWTNVEVRNVLANTAYDLGDPGRDELYGFGLVDADEAVPKSPVTIHSPLSVTNDSTPLLHATFDQIVALTWYIIDGAAGTGGSDTDNLTVILPQLDDGQHRVIVKANDSEGYIGRDIRNFIVDTIAPTATIDSVTSPTNVSSQTVTGSFDESGSGIYTIMVNGVEATFSGSIYSATINLIEGTNQVDVMAIDNAGNSGLNSTSIILDTTAPTVTIDPVTSLTNVSSQTITGTYNESDTGIDTITVNGVKATISDSTYSATINLIEGTNPVDVMAIDNAGNSGSNSTSIILDTTAPAVTIDQVTSPTNVNTQTVTGNFDEFGSGIDTITVNGVEATILESTYSATINLTEGTNQVDVIAIDNAGFSGSNSTSIILDTTAPTVTIYPMTSPTNVSSQTVTGSFNESDTGIATITVNGVEATISDSTYSATINLIEGANPVYVIAIDKAGNSGPNSTSIVLDTIAPTVTINSVTSPTNVSFQTVTGSFDETGSGLDTITVNGVEATFSGSTYSATINLIEGTNQVNVIAIDNAGYSGSNSTSIFLDTTVPTVTIGPVTSPTNVSSQIITGSFDETGSGVNTIMVNDIEATFSYPTYSATINLIEGTNPVDVIAIDDAGNSGSNSTSIVLDTTAPIAIITEPQNDTYVRESLSIEGTADDINFKHYVVEWKNGSTDWEEIANPTIPVSDGTLATWDTTTKKDGEYQIKLTVTDNVSNTNISTVNVIIDNTPLVVTISEPAENATLQYFENFVRGEVSDDNFNSARLIVRDNTSTEVSSYDLTITDNAFSQRVDFAPDQNNTLELSAIDKAGNFNNVTRNVFVENNTNQQTKDVNASTGVTIDAMNETDTVIEFYSNITENVTFTVTAITDQTQINVLNDSAFGEIALGKIVEINVTGLDATNGSEVQHVFVKLYYTQYDLDIDGDGTVEPGELDEDNLFIYWYNTTSDNWTKLLKDNPDWVIDNGQEKISGDNSGHVWVDVQHLSMFGLTALPEPEPSDDGEDDSGNGGSSGGGGGGGTSGEDFNNILITETEREYVSKDSDVSFSFDSEGNIVRDINFTGLTGSGRIAAKVEILKNTSTLVDYAPSDTVYMNLNIWIGNMGWATSRNIADATVSFKVEKSWVTGNDIDKSSIALYRYSDDNWGKLVTRKVSEDSNSLYFEAETSGFSPFAVAGKEFEGETGGEGIIPEPTATTDKTPVPTPTDKTGMPGFSLFAGSSVLLIAVQLLHKKK